MKMEMPNSFEEETSGVEEDREVSTEDYLKMTPEERAARWPIKKDNDQEREAA